MGQSAPENAQLCGSGEGGLRIFEAQQVLPIVQRLVNVGVRLNWKPRFWPLERATRRQAASSANTCKANGPQSSAIHFSGILDNKP